MGFSSSPHDHTLERRLYTYSRALADLSSIAAEASFHVKLGHRREAKRAIDKLERQSQELRYVAEDTDKS